MPIAIGQSANFLKKSARTKRGLAANLPRCFFSLPQRLATREPSTGQTILPVRCAYSDQSQGKSMTITARIDGVTWIPAEYRQVICPPPKAIKVSLDDRCQFQCGFCSRKDAEAGGEMSWDMYVKLIDEMAANGIKELGLFYIGEPMLAKKLAPAIRYAKDKGIPYVFLTTNGALATHEKVRELMSAGLNSLKFSFNYADGMQLKQIANVAPSNFEKIVQNIIAARQVRDANDFDCGIYASSIQLDGLQQEKMESAVERIRPYVDEHYWLPLFSFGGQTDFGTPVRGNPGRLDRMRDPLPCWAAFMEGHITSTGDISLCCFDSHSRWVVGNLATSSFLEAWNCQQAQDLRAAHLRKDVTGTACEHCAVGK